MKKQILISLLVSFIFINGKSQDIHFSQYHVAPLLLNPALSAMFNGDLRVALNYKDQWTSFGAGYKTYSFSADGAIKKDQWSNGFLGIGINIFNDVAGDANMSTTKVLLSISGIIDIDKNQQISMGIQGGMGQNSLNSNNLIWDDQYVNGAYNPGITTMDNIDLTPLYYGDISAGVSWKYVTGHSTISSYDASKYDAGIAIHHVNRPTQSRDQNAEKLYTKFILHSNACIGIKNTRLALKPGLLVAVQGPSREIVLGAIMRYRLQESSHFTGYFGEQALAIGGHYRLNDSFIPSVWYEFSNFAIGVSYDMNLSSLRAASNLRGGMEVSLRFQNPNPFTYKRWSEPSFN